MIAVSATFPGAWPAPSRSQLVTNTHAPYRTMALYPAGVRAIADAMCEALLGHMLSGLFSRLTFDCMFFGWCLVACTNVLVPGCQCRAKTGPLACLLVRFELDAMGLMFSMPTLQLWLGCGVQVTIFKASAQSPAACLALSR